MPKKVYTQDLAQKAIDAAPASATDLAVLFGVHRKTIWQWAKDHEEFNYALDYCLARREQDLIDKALHGKINYAFAKFLLSSQHGLVERSEVKNELVGKDGEALPPTQIVIVSPRKQMEDEHRDQS